MPCVFSLLPIQAGRRSDSLLGLRKTGIDAIWDMVLRYVELHAPIVFLMHTEINRQILMYETIHEQLRDRFYQDPEIIKMIAEVEKKVLANEISSLQVPNCYWTNML